MTPPLSRADRKWLAQPPTPASAEFIELASQDEALRAMIRAMRLKEEKPKRGRSRGKKTKTV